ncbi:hypothetical protein sos41_03480 [Alphaproteobacteria bacterium SO-S41]|nr:hypothetical protein sos41_03480 [Alphaproteobacteria bacterium SO-S41]
MRGESWISLCGALAVAGCASAVPEFVLSNDKSAVGTLVNNVMNHVKCELRSGYLRERTYDGDAGRLDWLKDSGAVVTLTLNVTEELSAGVDATPEFDLPGSDVLNLGLGTKYTQTAERNEEVSYYFPFSQFPNPEKTDAIKDPATCSNEAPGTIKGYLTLDRVFDDLLFTMRASEKPMLVPQTVSATVKFTFKWEGGANPVWTITRFVGGPAVNGSRERVSKVAITIGKSEKDFVRGTGKDLPPPTRETQQDHEFYLLRSTDQDSSRNR